MAQPSKSIPLVSVIIPVFNGAKHLNDAVLNVISQGYPNIEVLISDNCSDDSTWEIAQLLANTYPFVRAIRNEINLGAIKNIENLFRLSSGDLIWLRACGDYYSENFLNKCVEYHLEDCKIVLTIPQIGMYIENRLVYEIQYKETSSIANVDPIKSFPSVAFYGVYKRFYVNQCIPFKAIYGSDLLFIHDLYMVGKVILVKECQFRFESRKQRNSREQDSKFFFGSSKSSSKLPPGLLLTLVRATSTIRSNLNNLVKFWIVSQIFSNFVKEKLVILIANLIKLFFKNQKWNRSICTKLYNKMIKENYVLVIDEDMYWEFEICPRLRIRSK